MGSACSALPIHNHSSISLLEFREEYRHPILPYLFSLGSHGSTVTVTVTVTGHGFR